jgi:hypothetical protein
MSKSSSVPEPRKPVVREIYVLHSLPDRGKLTFTSFRPAYKEFVVRAKRPSGSVALWRGVVSKSATQWSKLYMSEFYPAALSEPYLNADV